MCARHQERGRGTGRGREGGGGGGMGFVQMTSPQLGRGGRGGSCAPQGGDFLERGRRAEKNGTRSESFMLHGTHPVPIGLCELKRAN